MANPTPLNRDVARASVDEELISLRAEVAHLRALVGPTEESYAKLRLDVLSARDAAKASEAELGQARARIMQLDSDVLRLDRDFVWFRNMVITRILGLKRYVPTLHKVVGRLSSR
jgi:hypothetical protein